MAEMLHKHKHKQQPVQTLQVVCGWLANSFVNVHQHEDDDEMAA